MLVQEIAEQFDCVSHDIRRACQDLGITINDADEIEEIRDEDIIKIRDYVYAKRDAYVAEKKARDEALARAKGLM